MNTYARTATLRLGEVLQTEYMDELKASQAS